MCANNLINGVYACASGEAQNTLLRGYSNFTGFLLSDYDGTRSTYESALGGLDIAMPGPPTRPDYFGTMLADALANKSLPVSIVDEKVCCSHAIDYLLSTTDSLSRPNSTLSYFKLLMSGHKHSVRNGNCGSP